MNGDAFFCATAIHRHERLLLAPTNGVKIRWHPLNALSELTKIFHPQNQSLDRQTDWRSDGRTDRRPDGRTDGQSIPQQSKVFGHVWHFFSADNHLISENYGCPGWPVSNKLCESLTLLLYLVTVIWPMYTLMSMTMACSLPLAVDEIVWHLN